MYNKTALDLLVVQISCWSFLGVWTSTFFAFADRWRVLFSVPLVLPTSWISTYRSIRKYILKLDRWKKTQILLLDKWLHLLMHLMNLSFNPQKRFCLNLKAFFFYEFRNLLMFQVPCVLNWMANFVLSAIKYQNCDHLLIF